MSCKSAVGVQRFCCNGAKKKWTQQPSRTFNRIGPSSNDPQPHATRGRRSYKPQRIATGNMRKNEHIQFFSSAAAVRRHGLNNNTRFAQKPRFRPIERLDDFGIRVCNFFVKSVTPSFKTHRAWYVLLSIPDLWVSHSWRSLAIGRMWGQVFHGRRRMAKPIASTWQHFWR